MVALQSRSHLHTSVAGDTIEMMLVALLPATYGAIQPETGLHSTRAHQVVSLLGQGLLGCGLLIYGSSGHSSLSWSLP